VFSATPARVEFVRPSITGGRRHLDLVTLTIETDSNGDGVVRRARPYDQQSSEDGVDDDGTTRSIIRLLSTPCNLRFAVPGGLPDEDTPRKVLPRAIMLEVENCGGLPDIPLVFPIPARSNPVLAARIPQEH
jgi:hypothetical protein